MCKPWNTNATSRKSKYVFVMPSARSAGPVLKAAVLERRSAAKYDDRRDFGARMHAGPRATLIKVALTGMNAEICILEDISKRC